jgi:hypothetical protein
MGGLWIQNLGKKLNLHKLVEVSPFRIITQIWYMLGINGCMCMYNPKYNSWNSWEAMGTFGSVKIKRKQQKSCFLCWCTRSASYPSPGRGAAESCEHLRATCEELRATCEELRATSGSLQQGAATLGKSFSSLGKLSNTLFNPFLSRVEVVLWS